MRENGRDEKAGRFDAGCVRAEELVAFVYGEARPEEADSFRQHLSACAACREEAAAFGVVREGLADWRAEVLNSAPSLDLAEALARETAARPSPLPVVAARRRSASAALREFFALSPLWLRAGAVAAVLALCALTTLTIMRTEIRFDSDGLAVRSGVPERVVTVTETAEAPPQNLYTREQVDAMVRERVERELADAREQTKGRPEQDSAVASRDANQKKNAPRLETANAKQPRRRVAPRGAPPEERRFGDDDESLPRLSDLLSGVH